ncbi:MAG TPA: hypothetical protein DCS93_10405 [Microscillaceae bacterium]|nr:hypothetical protein [Microscillaceae bacterium]
MKRVVLYIIYVSGLAWMITGMSSCANIIAPTGGPKDTLAPVLDTVRSFPKMEQLNYKGNVVLTFNEWIKTEKLKQDLIITPRVQNYSHKVVKKRLIITFLQPLDSNTTYNLDFRNTIQDITEGNATPVRLAFSTGSQLDTMQINGKVTELLSNAPGKATLLALYKEDDTLNVAEDPPYYLTQTDDAGYFNFKNIKANRYRLYAVKDANNNKYYTKGEMIGFVPGIIDLNQGNRDSLQIDLVKEDYEPPRLNSKVPKKHLVELNFNEGIREIKLDSGQTNFQDKIQYNIAPNGRKVILYNKQSLDSIRVRVIAIDSVDNRLSEEVTLQFNNKPIKDKDRAAFGVKIAPTNGIGVEDNQLELEFLFPKPVKNLDASKLKYLIDADTVNFQPLIVDSTTKLQWNEYRTKLTLTRSIQFKNAIKVISDTAAFISVIDDSTTLVQQPIQRIDPTSVGLVNIKVETSTPNFVIQLLDQEFELIKEQDNSEVTGNQFRFNNLPPGTYTIRVIIDENNNGRWDPSDFKKEKLAEKIFFYDNPVQLRANWEQNITVKF